MASKIQSSFNKSLVGSALPDAAIDISETSIDALIDNKLLGEIPIVKTIVGLVQTGANIQDRLFLKKILSFLKNINNIPVEERRRVIDDINSSKKISVSVGEKLLYIIDSCDDHTHAENVAKLFSSMFEGKITYKQYLNAAQITARISQHDLDLFIFSYTNPNYLEDTALSLSHTGLVYLEADELEVEIEKVEQASWKDPPEYYKANTYGGNTTAHPTPAGDTVFEVFGIGKKQLEQQMQKEMEKRKEKLRVKYQKTSKPARS